MPAEHIDDPVAERRFRPDHRQADAVGGGEFREFLQFIHLNRDALRIGGDTGVAGRAINLFHFGASFQLPDQRVFAPA